MNPQFLLESYQFPLTSLAGGAYRKFFRYDHCEHSLRARSMRLWKVNRAWLSKLCVVLRNANAKQGSEQVWHWMDTVLL